MRTVFGIALLGLLMTGCSSKLTRGLGAQEVVVYFSPTATSADRLGVIHACGHLPNAAPEPLPSANAPASSREYGVRFRVDRASNYQLQQLLSCLGRQPGVVGYNIPDQGQ